MTNDRTLNGLLPQHLPENLSKYELIAWLIWFNAKSIDERLCFEISAAIMDKLNLKESLHS